MRSASQLKFFQSCLAEAGMKVGDCPPCKDKNLARRVKKARRRLLENRKQRAKYRAWQADPEIMRLQRARKAWDEAGKGKKIKGHKSARKSGTVRQRRKAAPFNAENRRVLNDNPFRDKDEAERAYGNFLRG